MILSLVGMNRSSTLMQKASPVVVYFTPALPCSLCERAAQIGMVNTDFEGLLVRCYQHGLVDITPSNQKTTPTAYALLQLHASITRFVLRSFDDIGRAIVIAPIETKDIPGFVPIDPQTFGSLDAYVTRHIPDRAWTVRYENGPDATQREVYVVWSYDELTFTLYDEGKKR